MPCSCFKVGTSARRNARALKKKSMRDTCGIHAGYMRDICKGDHLIKIHVGYIRDTL